MRKLSDYKDSANSSCQTLVKSEVGVTAHEHVEDFHDKRYLYSSFEVNEVAIYKSCASYDTTRWYSCVSYKTEFLVILIINRFFYPFRHSQIYIDWFGTFCDTFRAWLCSRRIIIYHVFKALLSNECLLAYLMEIVFSACGPRQIDLILGSLMMMDSNPKFVVCYCDRRFTSRKLIS